MTTPFFELVTVKDEQGEPTAVRMILFQATTVHGRDTPVWSIFDIWDAASTKTLLRVAVECYPYDIAIHDPDNSFGEHKPIQFKYKTKRARMMELHRAFVEHAARAVPAFDAEYKNG